VSFRWGREILKKKRKEITHFTEPAIKRVQGYNLTTTTDLIIKSLKNKLILLFI